VSSTEFVLIERNGIEKEQKEKDINNVRSNKMRKRKTFERFRS
jgi:hypothetical protein